MPFRFHFARSVREGCIYLPVTSEKALFLFRPEVPVEDQSLTLRVARHPFPVAPELRVMRREQLEAGQGPLAEFVDDAAVPVHALHLPMGGQRTEVDDPHVPLGRLGLLQLFG